MKGCGGDSLRPAPSCPPTRGSLGGAGQSPLRASTVDGRQLPGQQCRGVGLTKVGVADSGVLDADEGFSRLELGLLDDGVVRADVQRSVVLFKDLQRRRP